MTSASSASDGETALFASFQKCMEELRFPSSVYVAEKLYCLNPLKYSLCFAQSLFLDAQFKRVIHLLGNSLDDHTMLNLYCKSLLSLGLVDDCQKMLKSSGSLLETDARFSSLQAQVFERNQLVSQAAEWWAKTLMLDPTYTEAITKCKLMGVSVSEPNVLSPTFLSVLDSAKSRLYAGNITACLSILNSRVSEDPYCVEYASLYCACLVQLKMYSELFFYAHRLLNSRADKAESWHAAGCYYYCIGKYDFARKFFKKATMSDSSLPDSWYALGHSFSLADENEQAVAVYRSCNRLFPESSLPLLYLSRESLRMNQLVMAEQFLVVAVQMKPTDPFICNELACVAFAMGDYTSACEIFAKTVELINLSNIRNNRSFAIFWSNLGFSYLKCRNEQDADVERSLCSFRKATDLNSHCAAAWLGLGYCEHLQSSYDSAINAYKTCLRISPFEFDERAGKGVVANATTMAKTLLSLAITEYSEELALGNNNSQ